MALTVFDLDAAPPARLQGGEQGLRMVVKRITFDSGYQNTGGTSGESLTAADLGLADTTIVVVQPVNGYVFAYNYDTDRVLAYWSGANGAASGQVTNGTNMATVTTTVTAIGTPSANE